MSNHIPVLVSEACTDRVQDRHISALAWMDSRPKHSPSGACNVWVILRGRLPHHLHGAAKLHHRRLQAVLRLCPGVCEHAAVHNCRLHTPGGTPDVRQARNPVGMLSPRLHHLGAGVDPVCIYSIWRGPSEKESFLPEACTASKLGCHGMTSDHY